MELTTVKIGKIIKRRRIELNLELKIYKIIQVLIMLQFLILKMEKQNPTIKLLKSF